MTTQDFTNHSFHQKQLNLYIFEWLQSNLQLFIAFLRAVGPPYPRRVCCKNLPYPTGSAFTNADFDSLATKRESFETFSSLETKRSSLASILAFQNISARRRFQLQLTHNCSLSSFGTVTPAQDLLSSGKPSINDD